MFLKNRTGRKVALARGRFLDDLAVASIVWRASYRWTPAGLVPWEGERAGLETDPPDTTSRPLWHGTSVTVAGNILGPGRAPRAARVELRVGDVQRLLVVWGERRWTRNAGRLVPSVPAPWTEMALSWGLAFGGGYEVPPGPHPATKLPHPGGRVNHPVNPRGTGLYPSAQAAEGNPLPSIESAEEPIREWSDQVRPVGFSPCPDLPGLRVPQSDPTAAPADVESHLRLAARLAHAAPGELIFGWLNAGLPIELRGAREQPIRFEVPANPVCIALQGARTRAETPPRVRSIHLSLDDRAVLIEHAHPFIYEPGSAPTWVAVEEK